MSDLEALAIDAAIGTSIAELHGVVIGLVAASGDQTLEAVHRVAVDLLGEGCDAAALEAFIVASAELLDDPELGFVPLLGDDDDPLSDRVFSLGEWVSGFLAGYGAFAPETSTDEVSETIEDFSSIASIDSDVSDTEESEAGFAELQEFVRIGALLVREYVT